MENVYVYIGWFEKACFLLIQPIILYLLSPQAMRMQHCIMSWFVLKKVFQVVFETKVPLHRVYDFFSFISCHLLYDNAAFSINKVCWVKTRDSSPFMQCSILLKDQACIFLCEIFVSFVSALHCRTDSWHDYEWWQWGSQICGFISWER